jgi:conjugative relaxase-like TrwC/TraI family protein
LTVATFRQTTSRADDPQIHTHAVISAKVQTPDGRWWALDARTGDRRLKSWISGRSPASPVNDFER